MSLKDKVLFITGASRGIGLAIALRAAKDGAKIAVAAKTAEPNPVLPGTVYTAAKEIEKAGGKALPLVCDIRDEEAVKTAINKTVQTFGGIDIVVNNASAISLTDTEHTPLKRYNLMNEINARGTWLVTKYAIPHLIESAQKSRNPHVMAISPPLSMKQKWFSPHVAYTMSKFGMSMAILGWSGELKKYGIAANALWPLTAIDTAALNIIDKSIVAKARKTDIMADAAHVVLIQDAQTYTGKFHIDELVLREHGQTEFDHYATVPGTTDFLPDLFVDDEVYERIQQLKMQDERRRSPRL
ncbi:7122_t:CDS:10 [Paraglomus occultum]|uniref:Hydroxysteroid dehydrogenase-like protein 2 n=1 Tax=Paraglomus occultum TaxID=144539 RepID=A0A9N9B016_9GLOM|nr:7122_t:CDS:10 [Paraglomus occultum]